MQMRDKNKISPWTWIPSLYFAEGLPYIAVNVLSVIMFKNLGMSNTDIALYTGWLYLPWVIKPFWSPFVDIIKTKRWWTVMMQLVMGLGFAAIAFTLPLSFYFQASMAVFWLIGFSSATHDIAADGYYMLALEPSEQSLFVGIRSTFYRCATIFGQGILVIIAGALETRLGDVAQAWSITFIVLSVFFLLISFYHNFIMPKPISDMPSQALPKGNGPEHLGQMSNIKQQESRALRGFVEIFRSFVETFSSFFKKRQIGIAILYILLYRFSEAQLVKLINPFLLDHPSEGGLGLTTSQVGFVYGTIGVIALTLGGIIGGIVVSRGGLKKWLWPMAFSLTLPNIVFCFLSMYQPDPNIFTNMVYINIAVFFEQFGYGFGFTAFLLYMMYVARGSHQTSHYAICTAFMALGMMLPGMAAGWIQEKLGYVNFFWWCLGCGILTLLVTALVKVDSEYAKKNSDTNEK